MRRLLILLAGLGFIAGPVQADIEFHAKPLTNAKIARGKGQCEIRLMVDAQVEVSLHGDTVRVHTLTGADARDSGSECSAPLPAHDIDGFALTVKKRQGEVKMVAEPSRRNDYTATFFIHGKGKGEGAYELRISWSDPSAAAPGINSNNAFHFAASGSGKAALNDAAPVLLGNVTVDIDRGGKAAVTFQIGRAGSATFTGSVMSWEGGVVKMDSLADARFQSLPGPLYVYLDASKQIYRVTLEATNGQDQLRVNWERK